jgi:5'-3' exoribonuclease 2
MFGSNFSDIKKHNNNIFINDYIFICYFLGNDFLPHLPSIDIKVDGMEIIIDAYMDIYQTKGTNIINIINGNVNIDNDFLLQFITLIASQEENYFCSILPNYLRKQQNRRCFENEKHKKELWKIENLKDIEIIDYIKLGVGNTNEWKHRYYSHYFNTDEYQQETINDICHNYLEGLLWVAKYYFEDCSNWRWQYKYTHAPFLSDIMIYLKNKNIMTDFITMYEKPVDIYTQLVSVIPSNYSHILPNSLRHLNCSYESPIIDMFPTEYKLDMIYKTQLYKCIPIIPCIELERIINCVKLFHLTEDEIIRSKKGNLLTFGN